MQLPTNACQTFALAGETQNQQATIKTKTQHREIAAIGGNAAIQPNGAKIKSPATN